MSRQSKVCLLWIDEHGVFITRGSSTQNVIDQESDRMYPWCEPSIIPDDSAPGDIFTATLKEDSNEIEKLEPLDESVIGKPGSVSKSEWVDFVTNIKEQYGAVLPEFNIEDDDTFVTRPAIVISPPTDEEHGGENVIVVKVMEKPNQAPKPYDKSIFWKGDVELKSTHFAFDCGNQGIYDAHKKGDVIPIKVVTKKYSFMSYEATLPLISYDMNPYEHFNFEELRALQRSQYLPQRQHLILSLLIMDNEPVWRKFNDDESLLRETVISFVNLIQNNELLEDTIDDFFNLMSDYVDSARILLRIDDSTLINIIGQSSEDRNNDVNNIFMKALTEINSNTEQNSILYKLQIVIGNSDIKLTKQLLNVVLDEMVSNQYTTINARRVISLSAKENIELIKPEYERIMLSLRESDSLPERMKLEHALRITRWVGKQDPKFASENIDILTTFGGYNKSYNRSISDTIIELVKYITDNDEISSEYKQHAQKLASDFNIPKIPEE